MASIHQNSESNDGDHNMHNIVEPKHTSYVNKLQEIDEFSPRNTTKHGEWSEIISLNVNNDVINRNTKEAQVKETTNYNIKDAEQTTNICTNKSANVASEEKTSDEIKQTREDTPDSQDCIGVHKECMSHGDKLYHNVKSSDSFTITTFSSPTESSNQIIESADKGGDKTSVNKITDQSTTKRETNNSNTLQVQTTEEDCTNRVKRLATSDSLKPFLADEPAENQNNKMVSMYSVPVVSCNIIISDLCNI